MSVRTGSEAAHGSEGPEATRAELLAAALRLFIERGYGPVTIDAVAEAAGYTKGAVYWHFDSKEALLVEVFEAWTREGVANLRRALREPDPARRVEQVDAWHSGDAQRSAGWVRFELEVLRLAAEKPDLAARLRERQRAVYRVLADALAEDRPALETGGAFRADELATLLSALSDGLLQHQLLDPGAVRGLFGRVVAALLPAGAEADRTLP